MTDQESKPYVDKYTEYNSVLRTWFVAFGVGVPGTLLINSETKGALSASDDSILVISFLLGGTVLQIFVAFLNKYVAWCNYLIIDRRNSGEGAAPGRFVQSVANLTERIWIDLVIDVITGILFVTALVSLYKILI